MMEELGAKVRPIAQVWHWEKPDWPLTLWGWTAELLAGDLRPDPAEVAEILWLTGEEVSDHPDGLPSNRLFVASLEAATSQEALK
jgi:NADH pyrophosphatase NudC (nudix superfamily)